MFALARYSKGIAALLGGVTPPALMLIAALAGFTLAPSTAVWVVSVLSPLLSLIATIRAPANAVKLPAFPPADPGPTIPPGV